MDYHDDLVMIVGMPDLPPFQVSRDFFAEYLGRKKHLIRIEDTNQTFSAKTGDCTKVYEMLEILPDLLQKLSEQAG